MIPHRHKPVRVYCQSLQTLQENKLLSANLSGEHAAQIKTCERETPFNFFYVEQSATEIIISHSKYFANAGVTTFSACF